MLYPKPHLECEDSQGQRLAESNDQGVPRKWNTTQPGKDEAWQSVGKDGSPPGWRALDRLLRRARAPQRLGEAARRRRLVRT
jgi:hypothetical protein